ncbi:hypothetical protein [Tessaracoccus massiliensis]|nr:hypothetical protein [Tessaracoccus massiliensis]
MPMCGRRVAFVRMSRTSATMDRPVLLRLGGKVLLRAVIEITDDDG